MKHLRKILDVAPVILLGTLCFSREEAEYLAYLLESFINAMGINLK